MSGTSVGLITRLICSMDCKSGDNPPCIVKIFSSIIAAIGKQLKQSVKVFHNLTWYLRLPINNAYIRHKTRKYDWYSRIRDYRARWKNFLGIWSCRPIISKWFPLTVFHDPRNLLRTNSLLPAGIHRTRIISTGHNIVRGYHLIKYVDRKSWWELLIPTKWADLQRFLLILCISSEFRFPSIVLVFPV